MLVETLGAKQIRVIQMDNYYVVELATFSSVIKINEIFLNNEFS